MADKNQEIALGLLKEHESNKAERSEWTDHWENCAKYGVPHKNNMYGQRVKGSKNPPDLFTCFAIWAIDFIASAFHGMLTNPSSVWFGLTTGIREIDRADSVRRWIDEAVHRMIDTLNGSNFQTEIYETYTDLASLGTNILKMEDDERDVINFQSIPIYLGAIDEDKRGDVVYVSREYEYTIFQIIEKFGELPTNIKNQLDSKNTEQLYKIVHIVKPRIRAELKGQLDVGIKKLPSSMKFVSYHVLEKAKYILEFAGFEDNPYAVPRWSKTADEKYGRSPLMKALADVKLLNAMKKVTIQGAQLKIAPPVETPDNGFLRPLNLKPFGVNYKRSTSRSETKPIYTGADPGIGLDIMEDVKKDIKQHFYIDQLQMIVADRMTATEVIQRRDEQLRTLGPLLGRLHRELLKPIIDRLFGLMLNKGLFPELPQELKQLKNGELKIKYNSAIAKAQITSESENIVRAIEATASIINSQPETLDLIDGDALLKYNWGIFGAPDVALRNASEVKKIRTARAEAQAKLSQQADDSQDAGVANQLSPLMPKE